MIRILTISIFLCSSSWALDPRVRVVVLDTGIRPGELKEYYCSDGNKDFTNSSLNDVKEHGTNIAGIIVTGLNPKKVCIMVYKVYHHQLLLPNYYKALIAIRKVKPYAVNFSISGQGLDWREQQLIGDILNDGVTFVNAVGNEGANLNKKCDTFPACYPFKTPRFIVVGNKSKSSNYGKVVDVVENGNSICYKDICESGSSQAAAVHLNKLLRKYIK